ncbi:MAG: fluoride efflux transporter CrcB [Nitratiruptor sp.]|nr:fluoride efflux transporter CrcB [Nitratiruptor sp.]NPA83687.1 fluoride efflux transporter CrcB [Campylobacterota bacterium]
MRWELLLGVGLGGFLGALGRFLLTSWIQRMSGSLFPWGTLSVNVLGSFLIGLLFVAFQEGLHPQLRAFAITGFLGALTTFSTFSLETYLMLDQGAIGKALMNILFNLSLSLGATILGIIVAKKIWGV